MIFIERIKQLREERKLTRRKLAEALDIDLAIYCEIEKGKRKAKYEQVIVIAEFLNSDKNELLNLWRDDQSVKTRKKCLFSKDKDWYVIPPSQEPREILGIKLGIASLFITIFLGLPSFFLLFSSSPFNTTVQITNWKEWNEPFLPKLELGIGVEDVQINDEGKANFIGIPSKYNNKKVPIKIKETNGMPYELVVDSIVISKDGISKIQIRLRGLEKLEAKVCDSDTEEVLQNAYVTCVNTTVVTNDSGKFVINIPPKKQQKEQRVKIEKDGYECYNKIRCFVEGSKPEIFYLKKKK